MKKKLCNRWACGGWNLLLKVLQVFKLPTTSNRIKILFNTLKFL